MQIVLLGTGGYHPSELRHTACVMLPELGIVLDAGTSFFRVRELLRTATLDIFLSHAHLDHVIGLTYLPNVVRDKQVARVTVHAAADKLQAIQQHLYSADLFPGEPPFVSAPLETLTTLSANVKVTSFALDHPGGSQGFRVESPTGTMAYVTDTTTEIDYVSRIADVDVLIHECYFADEFAADARRSGHSCTSAVARIATAANVGMLVLVHVNPLDNDEDPLGLHVAREIFAETHLGVDGMVIDLEAT